MTVKKQNYCRYAPGMSFESTQEGLEIFLPQPRGYVNYNIVRSVRKDAFADVYRLSKAFAYSDSFGDAFELTPESAEWDMAVKIAGRDDFIGGLVHGDEISEKFSAVIDGVNTDIHTLTALTPFREMRLTVDSVGYDPADHTTKVLTHRKEYLIMSAGITLRQKVEFLGSYALKSSYLAMMPPEKKYTDSYFTDKDPTPVRIPGSVRGEGARSLTVFGADSGIRFTMTVPEYPVLSGGNSYLITDNGGRSYNKMYFTVCTDTEVHPGDVWNSVTEYKIEVE